MASREVDPAVKEILWAGENVELVVWQRSVGPGGSVVTPTSVVATDKRIIIVNRTSLGMRHDFEVIPYRQIVSVRLEQGIISASVFIRVQGYEREAGLLEHGKEEGEIDGLTKADAMALVDLINRRITDENPRQPAPQAGAVAGSVYCSSCGARNPADGAFCTKCGAKLQKK